MKAWVIKGDDGYVGSGRYAADCELNEAGLYPLKRIAEQSFVEDDERVVPVEITLIKKRKK